MISNMAFDPFADTLKNDPTSANLKDVLHGEHITNHKTNKQVAQNSSPPPSSLTPSKQLPSRPIIQSPLSLEPTTVPQLSSVDKSTTRIDTSPVSTISSPIQSKSLNNTSKAQELLNIAEQEVGNKESGKNRGAEIDKYAEDGVGTSTGQPWCASFVSWCFKEAGINEINGQQFKPSASTTTLHNQFKDMGIAQGKDYTPKPGDIAHFKRKGGGHIGIVKSVNNGVLTTIEGNKSNRVKEVNYNLSSLLQGNSKLLGYSALNGAAIS